jgi:hypothetical protein
VINICLTLRKIGFTPKEYTLKKTKRALQNEKRWLENNKDWPVFSVTLESMETIYLNKPVLIMERRFELFGLSLKLRLDKFVLNLIRNRSSY